MTWRGLVLAAQAWWRHLAALALVVWGLVVYERVISGRPGVAVLTAGRPVLPVARPRTDGPGCQVEFLPLTVAP